MRRPAVAMAFKSDETVAMNRKQRRAAAKQGGSGPSREMAAREIPALFDRAIRLHQAGQWVEADATCRAILSGDPRHPGALHLLGVIAQQGGRFGEAAAHFRKLIAIRPDIAPAHQGLGAALAASGDLAGAAHAFEQTLKLGSNAADTRGAARIGLDLGNLYNQLGRLTEAATAYGRVLALDPDHAEAQNSLGAVLLRQDRGAEAAAHFARSLRLAPELFESYSKVSATLRRANPVLDQCVRRAVERWPDRSGASLSAEEFAGVAGDPMLACMLETATVRDPDLEKFLTGMRGVLLERAVSDVTEADQPMLGFACALARQCFINEYVFLDQPDELGRVERLKSRLAETLAAGRQVLPLWIAVLASYVPLSSNEASRALLASQWPEPVEALLTQQLRQVDEEFRLRDEVPRMTAVAHGVSEQVRRQYEENPYPRWVSPASRQAVVELAEYLRARFPGAPLQSLGARDRADILVAGCGTGEHPIGIARRFRGAHVLAIDLSLSSLCYALRKTRELGITNIEYAQADILELGDINRSFDMIDASGVLHHLADPTAGWRKLLALLRPRGLMRIGLYSKIGRSDIAAVRASIAERGYQAVAADIRRCRHALGESSRRTVARCRDFYSTSECRDLLFHVQEQSFTLPQIAEFLREQNLRFLGFEIDAAVAAAYRGEASGESAMVDLQRWDEFERRHPDTFAGMYQFWCQRAEL